MFKIKYKDLYLRSHDITTLPISSKYYNEDGTIDQRRFEYENKSYERDDRIYALSFTDDVDEASLFDDWDFKHMLRGIRFAGFHRNAKKVEMPG